MRNIQILLLTGLVFFVTACSSESLKRTGYETLKNVEEMQCEKDLTADCPERDSYETWQRKRQDSEDSE